MRRSDRTLAGFRPQEVRMLTSVIRGGGPEAHRGYQMRPLDWVVDKLGVERNTIVWSDNPGYDDHEWDGTPDPFKLMYDTIAQGLDVGIESATGTGKTFNAAALLLWFLACFPNAIVITAAPKKEQLLLHVWKEVGKFWPRFQTMFPDADFLTGKLRMLPAVEDRERWAATAFVCGVGADEESAARAQGHHAESMLIITEETPGIDRAIMNAFDNTRTAFHNIHLALGNPDSQHDELHRFCLRSSTTHIRVSALDHPNVVTGQPLVPAAISQRRIRERGKNYGEDSRLYRSRVRGISPAEAADALIRMRWCEEAIERYSLPHMREGPASLGVDVANSDRGDFAAIARFQGACLLEVTSFRCPDALQLAYRVQAEMGNDVAPRLVGVDSVGVGAATFNKLKELKIRVQGINAGERPMPTYDREARAQGSIGMREEEQFYNLRSQMWWYLRRDLQRGHVALPEDSELFEDLTAPQWWTRNGKIFVESKEELRKRLGRSPDKGDAVVMGNWVRHRPKRPKVRDDEPFDLWSPEVLQAEIERKYRHSTEESLKLQAKAKTGKELDPLMSWIP